MTLQKTFLLSSSLLLFTALNANAYSLYGKVSSNKDRSPNIQTNIDSDDDAPAEQALNNHTSSTTVKHMKIAIKAKYKGIVESSDVHYLKLEPKKWNLYQLDKIKDAGVSVKKGEVIAELDPKELSLDIKERKERLSEFQLTLERVKKQIAIIKDFRPLEKENFETQQKQFNEDLVFFKTYLKDMVQEQSDLELSKLKDQLNYSEEELNQLKKMYTEDELTEESEEIILTRQENQVKMIRRFLKLAEGQAKVLTDVRIPRHEQQLDFQKKVMDINAKYAKDMWRFQSTQINTQYKRMLQESAKEAQFISLLEEDLKQTKLISPIDGTLVYGAYENGVVRNENIIGRGHQKRFSLPTHTTLVTVLDPKKLEVKLMFPLDKQDSIALEQKVFIRPQSQPNNYIEATITEKSAFPVKNNLFSAKATFTIQPQELILPGTKCEVHTYSYYKEEALVLPQKYVYKESTLPFKSYVWVKNLESKKLEKRFVRVGKVYKKKLEIISGLKFDDKVYLP